MNKQQGLNNSQVCTYKFININNVCEWIKMFVQCTVHNTDAKIKEHT